VGDAETFVAHRDLMFSVAYRMLGTVADAEDAVQDAWLRWSTAPRDDVTEPRAYLARTVTNVALNRLRAAQARREAYVGPWLPEPLLTRTDPGSPGVAERAELGGLDPRCHHIAGSGQVQRRHGGTVGMEAGRDG
jgi:DNA-directed RNA polymerase specialized sigma24 family protein